MGNVQCAIPHFLELLVADWRSMVENVDSSLAVHTCITLAQIQLCVGRKMTNALAHERPKTYQYQRPQCAYGEYDRESQRQGQKYEELSQQRRPPTSVYFFRRAPDKVNESPLAVLQSTADKASESPLGVLKATGL
jgi:hypothetical protein